MKPLQVEIAMIHSRRNGVFDKKPKMLLVAFAVGASESRQSRLKGSSMDRRSFLRGTCLVGVTAAATYFLSRPRTRRPNGHYIQMGTSITAGYHGPGSYLTPFVVGERLNLVPVNVGFDGATVPPCTRTYSDDFCLEQLVKAVHSRDWTAQDASIEFMNHANKLSLSLLKALAFDEVNTFVGLEYGVNDFTVCVPIETFRASLKQSAATLLSDFPKMRLFTIGPAWYPQASEPNKLGLHLTDYATAAAQVSRDVGIPFLDMMMCLPINEKNVSVFTNDGEHPNETGARVRGELTASFIQQEFR